MDDIIRTRHDELEDALTKHIMSCVTSQVEPMVRSWAVKFTEEYLARGASANDHIRQAMELERALANDPFLSQNPWANADASKIHRNAMGMLWGDPKIGGDVSEQKPFVHLTDDERHALGVNGQAR